MSTLLSVLRGEVRASIRDSNAQFIGDNDIDLLLSEGYRDIVARLRLNAAEATGTITTDGYITLPSTYMETESLWIDGTQAREVTDDTFDFYTQRGDTTLPPGPDVLIYRFFASRIETAAVDRTASQPYVLRYQASTATLTAGSTTAEFTYLPVELEPRLVNYARAHINLREGNIPEFQEYMRMFEQGMPSPPRAAFRHGRGPDAFIPAPSPFDEF